MFLVSHLDGGRSPLNPYEWLENSPQEVWMDNIHVEVIADDTSRRIDPSPITPIYPNSGGLIQYGLNRWREMGPLPGGHRKFWYLAKCLYDGDLTAPAARSISREKRTSHIIQRNVKQKFPPYWRGSSGNPRWSKHVGVRPWQIDPDCVAVGDEPRTKTTSAVPPTRSDIWAGDSPRRDERVWSIASVAMRAPPSIHPCRSGSL
jgi:hypothetical protein